MSTDRKASTMSVPQMRGLLGLKKTESYWLLQKNYFDVITVNGRMRVVIDSFEKWYERQLHYRKVDGPAPGSALKRTSFSIKEIADMLGISKDSVYPIIRKEHLPYTVQQNGQWMIDRDAFNTWYASQTHYRKQDARDRDRDIEEQSVTIPEFGRSLGLTREQTYPLVRRIHDHLEFVTVGDRQRITRTSIEKWRKEDSSATLCKHETKRPQKPKPPETIPANKQLFTPNEAAEFLDVSVRTIYRLMDENRLALVRVGRQLRIRRETLASWETAIELDFQSEV